MHGRIVLSEENEKKEEERSARVTSPRHQDTYIVVWFRQVVHCVGLLA
jgi:hypothetical protein